MAQATILATRGILSAPAIITPNRYDGAALLVLDAERITGVANGARVTEVMARGTLNESWRRFNRSTATGTGGQLPKFRSSLGPDGGPCLQFEGYEGLRNEPSAPLDSPLTLCVVWQNDLWDASETRRIVGRGSSADLVRRLAARPRGYTSSGDVQIYAEGSSFLSVTHAGDPTILQTGWRCTVMSFAGMAGKTRVIDNGQYLEGDLVDTGMVRTVFGANYATAVEPGGFNAGDGLVGKLVEFKMYAGAMTEAQLRNLYDEQVYRYNLA